MSFEKRIIAALCSIILLTMWVSCNFGIQAEDEPEAGAVTGVTLDRETLTLTEHGTYQLTAAITPDSATNQNISWSSDGNSVASVDQNGLVTAIAEGTAIITVTTEDGGHTDSCTVTTITDPDQVVELDQRILYFLPGNTAILSATVTSVDTSGTEVSWSSDNAASVSVEEDGTITAIAPGRAVITAAIMDGEFSDECTVYVLADEGFISIWDMSLTETDTLTLPLNSHGTFSFTVDWGDGTSEEISTSNAAHTYAESGVFAVVITGTCSGFGFTFTSDETNEDNLVDILRWGEMRFHNNGYVFAGCDNLAAFSAADTPDLTGITNMRGMFSRTASFSADLSAWDTSSVTDMAYMFFLASGFNGNITPWDTSRVMNMSYMFRAANSFNGNISAWNTGNVSNFGDMFSNAGIFNNDISGWDTGSGTDFSYMFNITVSFNQDLSEWNVTNAVTTEGMFDNAMSYTNGGNPGGLNEWELPSGCNTTNMFANCPLNPQPDWYGEAVPVSGVYLTEEQLFLNPGETHQLSAVIEPADATNKNLRWRTSAATFATVNTEGNVTATLFEGTAVITVETEDGSFTDSCTVTVQSNSGYIIANHESVEKYADIPQEYIDIVKTWLVDAAGESHSEGYRTGVDSTNGLGSIDSRFSASTFTWGLPAATDQALRMGTHATVGEGDFWTNDTAKETIKDLIRQQHEGDNPIHVIFQAWCGDMVRTTGPAGAGTDGYDPVYGCHWLGSSVGGPDGNHIWGLDAGDFTITGNGISLQTYLDTIDEYNEYCRDNGYITTALFTTGPVDGGSASSEAGYQRYVKHQRIREYVMESDTRVLFDYADILSWNDAGEQHLETWTSPHTGQTYTFPAIHPDNDTEDTGHISYAGALRIGKAIWWLLARMAGWNGSTQ